MTWISSSRIRIRDATRKSPRRVRHRETRQTVRQTKQDWNIFTLSGDGDGVGGSRLLIISRSGHFYSQTFFCFIKTMTAVITSRNINLWTGVTVSSTWILFSFLDIAPLLANAEQFVSPQSRLQSLIEPKQPLTIRLDAREAGKYRSPVLSKHNYYEKHGNNWRQLRSTYSFLFLFSYQLLSLLCCYLDYSSWSNLSEQIQLIQFNTDLKKTSLTSSAQVNQTTWDVWSVVSERTNQSESEGMDRWMNTCRE